MRTRYWLRALLAVPAALVLACNSSTGPEYPPDDDPVPEQNPPSEGALLPTVTDTVQAD